MKKLYLILTVMLVTLFACEQDFENLENDEKTTVETFRYANIIDVVPTTLKCGGGHNAPTPTTDNCDDPEMITFDNGEFIAGDFVDSVETRDGKINIYIEGEHIAYPDENAAMIFNSSEPPNPGDDLDLGTPNEMYGGPGIGEDGESNKLSMGNVLIISEDMDPTDPDDLNWSNGKLWFDFSAIGEVTLISLDVIDIEDNVGELAYIIMYDADDNELNKLYMPYTGNNGFARLDMEETSSVVKMMVRFGGSGAIDNITYCYSTFVETGCTKTQGYWKTHSLSHNNPNYDPIWDLIGDNGEYSTFYITNKNWYQVIKKNPKGNAYYILAKQYIAAKLNILTGAEVPIEVNNALSYSADLFETYTPNQVKKFNKRKRRIVTHNARIITRYNEGKIGPGHCN